MRYLTIVRHAKSGWDNPAQPDFERTLSTRGEHDARLMGERLAMQRFRPDLVVSSPARRAMQTASLICENIGIPVASVIMNDNIYEATLGALQQVVEALPDTGQHVMLFGHNPGFEALCNYVEAGSIATLTTCNVVQYRLDIDVWKAFDRDCGELISHQTPKDRVG
ncbi:MAG: histidine phosphatase family protein [Gammaproteobacteria bacterium]|nr:histidine phosphatase family protein [Gammaproteobacteria bacterium]